MYAPSWEIREYLEHTAQKYGADRFIKLQHEVVQCHWHAAAGQWEVRVRGPDGTIFTDSCHVLVSARGLLNTKQWPDIAGLRRFAGEVMHSAAWNADHDFTGKRVGVIGSGSSAIQMSVSV